MFDIKKGDDDWDNQDIPDTGPEESKYEPTSPYTAPFDRMKSNLSKPLEMSRGKRFEQNFYYPQSRRQSESNIRLSRVS